MDIWDIEIITHVAEGGNGARERKRQRDPRLQEAADSRATARYRVGVLSRAYILPALTHTRLYVHTRLQIDIAGRIPAPE